MRPGSAAPVLLRILPAPSLCGGRRGCAQGPAARPTGPLPGVGSRAPTWTEGACACASIRGSCIPVRLRSSARIGTRWGAGRPMSAPKSSPLPSAVSALKMTSPLTSARGARGLPQGGGRPSKHAGGPGRANRRGAGELLPAGSGTGTGGAERGRLPAAGSIRDQAAVGGAQRGQFADSQSSAPPPHLRQERRSGDTPLSTSSGLNRGAVSPGQAG